MSRLFHKKNVMVTVLFWMLLSVRVIFGNVTDTYASDADFSVRHSISAYLYDTADYGSGGSGVALTKDGISALNWRYQDAKYLQIDVQIDAGAYDTQVHVVEVVINRPFYTKNDLSVIPTGFSNVECISEPNQSTNFGAAEYDVNDNCGVIRYYLKPNITRATIQMELAYDPVLWDKLGYSALTEPGVKPISVSLMHKEDIGQNPTYKGLMTRSVSRATSAQGIIGTGTVWYKKNWDSGLNIWDASTSFVGYKDDKLRMMIFTTEAGKPYIDKYYKKVTVEINIPYAYINGQKHYMEYDPTHLIFDRSRGIDELKGKVISATETKVVYYVDDYHVGDDRGINIDMWWPEDLHTYQSSVTFGNGSYRINIITNEGIDRCVFSGNINNIKYQTTGYEQVVMDDAYTESTMKTNEVSGAYTHLGGFNIQNKGTMKSSKKDLKMIFHKKQLVTAVNAPYDLISKELNFTYTLKDEMGNPVYLDDSGKKVASGAKGAKSSWTATVDNPNYGKSKYDNIYVRLTRKHIPTVHRKYYFNTVQYTLGTIRKSTSLYSLGLDFYGTDCGGRIYGKLASSAYDGEKLTGRVILTSPSSSGIPSLTLYYNSYASSKEDSTVKLLSAKFEKDGIRAGDSVKLSGQFQASYLHMQGQCSWLRRIKMAIVLPKYVSLNERNITLRYNKTLEDVDIKKITKKTLSYDRTMYTLELDDDVLIGYALDDMSSFGNGDTINFEFILDTSRNMDMTTLNNTNMLYVAGYKQNNSAKGDLVSFAVTDTYDLNGDGRKYDNIAGIRQADKSECIVMENPSILDISAKLYKNNGTTADTMAIMGKNSDFLTYNLNIKCEDDGQASSFDYYIPIPKANATSDEYLQVSEKANFDMKLTGEATLTGNPIYSFKYTTVRNSGYVAARHLTFDNWYTADEIRKKGIPWEDVTMVKVSLENRNLTRGMESDIRLDLKYQGDNIDYSIGCFNEWRSCGYYTFKNAIRTIEGHFGSNSVMAAVETSSLKTYETTIKVTKAKVTSDENFGTGKVDDILPYYNNHNVYIEDIQTNGILLKEKSYMESKKDTMTAAEANKYIALTVTLNNGEEVDLSEGKDTKVGELVAGMGSMLQFKAYHSDAYTDTESDRYVEVTLRSNDGLRFKIKVNIVFCNVNKVIIENGEQYGENKPSLDDTSDVRIFQAYDLTLYEGITLQEKIKFSVERATKNESVDFEVGYSATPRSVSYYVNPKYIKIHDSKGNVVPAKNGKYKLKPYEKYELTVVSNKALKSINTHMYLHTLLPGEDAYAHIVISRKTAFLMN